MSATLHVHGSARTPNHTSSVPLARSSPIAPRRAARTNSATAVRIYRGEHGAPIAPACPAPTSRSPPDSGPTVDKVSPGTSSTSGMRRVSPATPWCPGRWASRSTARSRGSARVVFTRPAASPGVYSRRQSLRCSRHPASPYSPAGNASGQVQVHGPGISQSGFSSTRRDRVTVMVVATISMAPSLLNAWWMSARAPPDAYPWPQAPRRSR